MELHVRCRALNRNGLKLMIRAPFGTAGHNVALRGSQQACDAVPARPSVLPGPPAAKNNEAFSHQLHFEGQGRDCVPPTAGQSRREARTGCYALTDDARSLIVASPVVTKDDNAF